MFLDRFNSFGGKSWEGGVVAQAKATACKTDCSAKPIRNFPANDLIKYLASAS